MVAGIYKVVFPVGHATCVVSFNVVCNDPTCACALPVTRSLSIFNMDDVDVDQGDGKREERKVSIHPPQTRAFGSL